jgi:hypothetical protein
MLGLNFPGGTNRAMKLSGKTIWLSSLMAASKLAR